MNKLQRTLSKLPVNNPILDLFFLSFIIGAGVTEGMSISRYFWVMAFTGWFLSDATTDAAPEPLRWRVRVFKYRWHAWRKERAVVAYQMHKYECSDMYERWWPDAAAERAN